MKFLKIVITINLLGMTYFKTVHLMAVVLTAILFTNLTVKAQGKSDLRKALRKELERKTPKDLRKQARGLEKDGWYVLPGALPMDKQLEKSQIKELEEDENGYQKWIIGTGSSVAGAQSAAKLQAVAVAKIDLARQVGSVIGSVIETNISTQQIAPQEAATISETVSASSEVVAQTIGRVITLSEMYRKVNKTNMEAQVRIAYNQEAALEAAKKTIKKELQDKTNVAREKLDKLMNF